MAESLRMTGIIDGRMVAGMGGRMTGIIDGRMVAGMAGRMAGGMDGKWMGNWRGNGEVKLKLKVHSITLFIGLNVLKNEK